MKTGYPTALFQSRTEKIISREYFIKCFRQWQSGNHAVTALADRNGNHLFYRGREARVANYTGGAMIEWQGKADSTIYAAENVRQFVDMVNMAEAKR